MTHLLRTKDLCARLHWSLSTVHNRRSQGKSMPPALKIGGQLRFPEDELIEWLETHRHAVSNQPLK